MIKAFKLLFLNRRLLWATTIYDIRGRYAGTMLGITWTLLYPLLFLGLYAIVYIMIFKIRLSGYTTFDYVLLIFSGLIPFLGFSEALGTGVGSVTQNQSLIKNVIFPIELIPAKAVLSSSVTMIVGMVILQSILWAQGNIHISQLILPIIFIAQLIFTMGLIWLLSALNVFFKDLGQMTSILTLFLMLVSPIAYTQDMVPEALMPFMYPNPLYYLIMLYRETMVLGQVPFDLLGIFLTISLTTFWFGFYVFSRLKPVFSDYV